MLPLLYVDKVGLGYLVCNVLPADFDPLMLESSMGTFDVDWTNITSCQQESKQVLNYFR